MNIGPNTQELLKNISLLAIKDQQLLQEKEQRVKAEIEAKEKLQRVLKFNQATKQVEPQEYIYIVTTDEYMLENGCGHLIYLNLSIIVENQIHNLIFLYIFKK